MEIRIILAQRKCSYPGQYGPETLGCASEYEYDENPDYLNDILKKSRESDEFDAVELVSLSVLDILVENALFPNRNAIPVSLTTCKQPS